MSFDLVLVPTQLELDHLVGQPEYARIAKIVTVCGFGPVAAAAHSTRLIAERSPQRILLVGIAGTYDTTKLPVGEAAIFDWVALHGVGVGHGREHLPAEAIGFSNVSGEPVERGVSTERLELANVASKNRAKLLLSCCAASSTAQEVALRRGQYPDAVAEDMEGFSVATACRLFDVPLTILRGVSNVAGNRDSQAWRIADAMNAAWQLARQIL